MALNPYLEKVLGDASMPKIQFVDINESLEYIGTATVQTGSQSNTDVNKEVPGASMPSFPVLECPSNSEYIVVPEESDPSTSEVPNNASAGSGDTDKTASGLKTVPTAPKTIYINKPPVTTTTASSSLDATAGSEKSATPKRQLQLILENGRMIAAPQPVGRPNVDSTKTAAAGHDASSPAVSKQRPKVTVLGPSGSRLDLSNTADEIAKQTESVLNVDVIAESDGNAVAGGTRGNDADSVASVEAVGSTCTCTPDYPCEVIDVLPPVGTKRKSRVVYSKVRPLVEAPTASAVLDAVQSAAGLSHLVFESKGRHSGTMISTKDGRKDKENAELLREDDQQRLLAAQSQQQVVITSQQGDQQVLVTLDGDLLRTAGASDASNLLLQVDEASDSVTLLVNRPGKEGMYEIAGEEGELLELWERDSKGNDRLLGTVSEVSLVDIRAVCEQCNCVISHHMVGMLVREDGSEYGYRCRLCQCVQTDVDVMARHMESHRSLADTQCRFCSRGLRTFQPQHPRSFPCHACDKVFSTRSEMLKHREVHPPKRRFPCEMCDKTFQVKVQLEVHVRTHLGHKPYTCDMCTAAFTQPSHLINHRRTHTGERPYVCRQCGRAFVQQGHLRSHERTHTGERPYKCDLCGRGFRQSGQLTAHKKLHEGDAPCKLRRRFDDPITPEELTCQECNKTFKLPKDLKRHMLVHSEGQYKCEICERAFKRPDHLLRHKRQHDATRRKMKRRLRREVKLQDESLTRLDRVIDDVLDEPYRLQLNNVMEKLQPDLNDQGDFRVEANDEDSEDDCDDSNEGVDDGEDSDDREEEEEDDRDERHTRVSSAPKDALWSQTDHNYDPRRQQADRQDEQKLGRSPPYGTRSRLLRESFTDHGVDEEMAILEAAFNEQRVRTGGKGKKSWDVPKGRLNSEEQTVKLEPIDWVECDIGGGGDGNRRDVDRNTGGKRKRLRGATDAEDLVLSVWDDGDTVEVRPAARVKLEDHPTRTTARSTAGNRAASVGVSLTRSSHHGGRR